MLNTMFSQIKSLTEYCSNSVCYFNVSSDNVVFTLEEFLDILNTEPQGYHLAINAFSLELEHVHLISSL